MRNKHFLLALTIALTGCGPNWQPLTAPQLTEPQSKPLDQRAVIEFRVKEQMVRLHGVRFARDSISGIPWLDHLTCDTCRVGYALMDVSGLRRGNPGAGAWWILGPLIGILSAGALVALSWRGD